MTNSWNRYGDIWRAAQDGDEWEVYFREGNPKTYRFERGRFDEINGVHVLSHTSQIITARLIHRKEENND